MHCVLLVIAAAVYVTVLHLGLVISASTERERSMEAEVRKTYNTAMIVSYVLAALATIAFCLYRRDKSHLLSFWATAMILFFGGSYAIYKAYPKKVDVLPTPHYVRVNRSDAMSKVHLFALFSAVITYCTAKLTLTPPLTLR